jgi:TPR repeat protein
MNGRRGVPPRLAEAERWLRLAADTDVCADEARTNLGLLYETGGPGVRLDYTAAARYYRFNADKGNPICQTNYGRLLMEGRGVPQNQRAAVQLYTLAADSGVAPAQHNLAIAYMNGTGVRADLHKARSLLELAAAQGHRARNNATRVTERKRRGWAVRHRGRRAVVRGCRRAGPTRRVVPSRSDVFRKWEPAGGHGEGDKVYEAGA